MPKSVPPREDLFSVTEAAERLEITERQVWNLIKSGELVTEKTVAEAAGELITEETKKTSNRVWISLVEINRYRLIHGKNTRLDHAFSRFPSSATPNFQRYIVFGPWGGTGNHPQFELELTIDDWLRLAAKPVTGQAEYEKIRAEVRSRLGPGAPESFAVRFNINQADLAQTLNQIVYPPAGVKVPKRLIDHYNGDENEIRDRAKEHLLNHTLLRIDSVRGNLRNYLIRSVKHCYIDLLRSVEHAPDPMHRLESQEITFGGPDEDEVESQGIELGDMRLDHEQAAIDLAYEKGLTPERSLAALKEAFSREIAEKYPSSAASNAALRPRGSRNAKKAK